jgi:hypothetical protein
MKKRRYYDFDDDWGSWFPALMETKWADTRRPLTRAELRRTIQTGTTRRPLEISVRVPKGTETIVLPAGRSIFEADGLSKAIYEAIGTRLRRRKISSKQIKEQFYLMCTEGRVVPKHVRRTPAMKKRGSRKVLADIKAQSQKPFSEELCAARNDRPSGPIRQRQ